MYQKIGLGLGKGLLWLWSVFLLLVSLGVFSMSVPGGITVLLAAVVSNPLFLKLYNRYGKAGRMKAVTVVLSVVLLFVGVMFTPTKERTIEAQEQAASAMAEQTAADLSKEETEAAGTQEPEAVLEEEKTEPEATDPETATDETTTKGKEIADKTQAEDTAEDENADPDTLEVHFLDVGQGDCTLIRCGEASMLIDAGVNGIGTKIQNYLQKQGVKELDYLVLTHPDADHIGSADVVITKFPIGSLFMSDYTKDNKTYERLMQAIDYKGLKSTTPRPGDSYALGDAQITFLSPAVSYTDPNNASLALKVSLGENSFLFTGDCEEKAEQEMLKSGLDLSSEVYKVGHHGSKTSSCKDFLQAVAPSYGVISCGEGNDYGHPHAETLNNLRAMGVKLFRTDEQGTIVAEADGKEIKWNCSPTESWKAGEATASSTKEQSSAKAAASSTQSVQESKADVPVVTETQPSAEVQTPEQPQPEPEQPVVQEPAENSGSNFGEAHSNQFILNKNSGVLHKPSCSYLPKEKNQLLFNTVEEAMASPQYDHKCGHCW